MSGIDDIVNELTELGEGIDDIADDMLMAGAEEVKKSWQFSAAAHGLKHTGDMIDSIGYAKKPKKVGDVRQIDIYPQGKDGKGVRNAEKAFILHYGSSSIKSTHWVDDADEMCEGEFSVQTAMEAAFDKGLQEKGMK